MNKEKILKEVVECVKSFGGNVTQYGYRTGEPFIIKVEVEDYKEVNINALKYAIDDIDTVDYMGRSYGEFYFKLKY